MIALNDQKRVEGLSDNSFQDPLVFFLSGNVVHVWVVIKSFKTHYVEYRMHIERIKLASLCQEGHISSLTG